MTDPNAITKFDRSDDELLEFWLFCLFVRGKNATVQAQKLAYFVDLCRMTPNTWITLSAGLRQNRDDIDGMLRSVKSGQYESLTKAITQTLLKLEEDHNFLREAPIQALESIDGVGPKTSRFFLLHSRPNVRVAVLDTHILHFLGLQHNLPISRSTPTAGRRYDDLESQFLFYADAFGVDPAALDLAIWRASRESSPLDWRNYMEDPK